MGEGLYDPLGAGRPTGSRRGLPAPLVTAAGLFGAVVLFGVIVAVRGGGERGEPGAIVPIDRSAPAAAATPSPPPPVAAQGGPAQAVSPPASSPAGAAAMGTSGREVEVEIQNGVRIVRMRPDAARPPSGQVLSVPSPAQRLPGTPSGLPATGTP